jgi:dipeptidyl aminopeptidase/acylaminoacyl peptidase
MAFEGPFSTWRVTKEQLESLGAVRERRRDLAVWNSHVSFVANLGPNARSVLVQLREGRVVTVTEQPVGSSLNGYGAPCWCPVDDDRALIIRADEPLVELISAHGDVLASYATGAAVAVAYPRPCANGFVVLIDEGPELGRSIRRIDWNGSHRVIYRTNSLVGDVVIDESGQYVAWLEWSSSNMPWDAARLAVAELSENLTPRWLNDAHEPAAQPFFAGSHLYFSLETGEWSTLFRTSAPGFGDLEPLRAPEADFRPDWCFARSWSAPIEQGVLWAYVHDSRAAVALVVPGSNYEKLEGSPEYIWEMCSWGADAVALVSTTREASQLWTFDITRRRWRSLEEPPQRSRAVREVTHRRTPRGVPFVWRTPLESQTRRVASDRPGLVVTAHGGPTAYASLGFDLTSEFLAQAGMAVASVDYRGSSSYGRSYRQALNGQWGLADVQDLINVLEYLESSGEIDPERIFVRGSSAGALSALLASRHQSVRGVVALSAVTDLRFLARHTLEFEREYVATLLGDAMTNDALYAERSPLLQVQQLSRRALVIHGSDDEVAPIAPIYEMVAALRASGAQVQFLELSGEGHSFRDPANSLLAYEAELAFYGA